MKKWIILLVLLGTGDSAFCQSQEAEQLLLNVEKLSQLKSILTDMQKGYTIITQGYNSVKEIAQGNFSLHRAFLDGMMLVSPEIKKYRRVADIITCQKDLVAAYKSAFKHFRDGGNFTSREIKYLEKVYQQLFGQSVDNLDQLAMVITDSKLRMSDDERLQAIDRIFADTSDKLQFLRQFNQQASLLELQRKQEIQDVSGSGKFYKFK